MALSTVEEELVRQLIEQNAALLSLASSEPTILSKLAATKVSIADLTAASAIDDADLFLIRQGISEKSVSGAILKTLSSVEDASETVKGIAELATSAEVIAGTDTTRIVTPAALQAKVASETAKGIIEIATTAEAQALTNDLLAITPKKLADSMKGSNVLLSANGYQKLPSGLIIQWGVAVVNAGTSLVVTLPITFPNAFLRGFTTVGFNSAVGAYTTGVSVTPSASSITLFNTNSSAGAATTNWLAIGY